MMIQSLAIQQERQTDACSKNDDGPFILCRLGKTQDPSSRRDLEMVLKFYYKYIFYKKYNNLPIRIGSVDDPNFFPTPTNETTGNPNWKP